MAITAALTQLASKLKSGGVRAIAALLLGSGLGQVISLASQPILTRLFGPAEFAVYAIFAAVVVVFGSAVALRFDGAIPVADSRRDAQLLVVVCMYSILFFVAALVFALMLPPLQLANILGAKSLGIWIFLVPVVLIATGLYSAIKGYANHGKYYSAIGQAAVVQATCGAAVSIVAGLLASGPQGLMLSMPLSVVAGAAWIAYAAGMRLQHFDFKLGADHFELIKRFKDFPLFSAPTNLLAGFTFGLPVIILAHAFGASEVGCYALASRILGAPIALMAGSVGQVLVRSASEKVRLGQCLVPYVQTVSLYLLLAIALPSMVVSLWGEDLFVFVFGSEWRLAGASAAILIVGAAVRFVVSPISVILTAIGRVRLVSYWEVGSFTFSSLVLFVASGRVGFEDMMRIFAAIEVLKYGIYYFLIIWSIRRRGGEQRAL